jgi:hypothetical protein
LFAREREDGESWGVVGLGGCGDCLYAVCSTVDSVSDFSTPRFSLEQAAQASDLMDIIVDLTPKTR